MAALAAAIRWSAVVTTSSARVVVDCCHGSVCRVDGISDVGALSACKLSRRGSRRGYRPRTGHFVRGSTTAAKEENATTSSQYQGAKPET